MIATLPEGQRLEYLSSTDGTHSPAHRSCGHGDLPMAALMQVNGEFVIGGIHRVEPALSWPRH